MIANIAPGWSVCLSACLENLEGASDQSPQDQQEVGREGNWDGEMGTRQKRTTGRGSP